MVHIGNTPASNFASVTKDTFSGNGSTTAFTLSKTATTNGVAVYVENVRQIPTTAYSVSGTTLTFTAAPVSGTNNIYVLHHNTPASTATHPSAQALTATTGTFTSNGTFAGTLGVTGTTKLGEIASIGQATPLSPNDATSFLHIGDNNNQDTSIILEDAVEIWEIYQNDTLSFRKDTTIVQELHRDGYVTQPLQPAVFVQSGNDANKTGDGTTFTIELDVERYDTNADFNTTNYTFTAPVTGKYFMSATISLEGISSHERVRPILVTSNRHYTSEFHGDNLESNNQVLQINSISTVADMDANDTATFTVLVAGGSKDVDIRDETSLSIALVC